MIPEYDLLFLHEAVIDLKAYILSQDLFWLLRTRTSAAYGSQLPQLTLGNLLLSQARLAACCISSEEEEDYKKSLLAIQRIREEWLSNWQIKEEHEFGARLNLWQQYLCELRSDLRRHAAFYPREVRARVIMQLFLSEGLVKGVNRDQLTMLDQMLRGLSRPGPFIWEAQIENGFPREQFWFLYVTLNDGGRGGKE